jgi:predicted nucleic acid-binding protein
MTTASDPALVDTNVLVFSLDQEASEHAAARSVTNLARNATANLFVAPQNLAELYAVITNHKRVRHPRTEEEALGVVTDLMALPGLTLLPVPTTIVSQWVDLVRRRPVRGAKIFDLQLVATMLGAGVRRIYTFNRDDFAPFAELEVIVPTIGVREPNPTPSTTPPPSKQR